MRIIKPGTRLLVPVFFMTSILRLTPLSQMLIVIREFTVDESQQGYVEVQSSLLVLQTVQVLSGHSAYSGQCRLNGILRVDTNLSQ